MLLPCSHSQAQLTFGSPEELTVPKKLLTFNSHNLLLLVSQIN